MQVNSNYDDISILTVPYIPTTPEQQQYLIDLFDLLPTVVANYLDAPNTTNKNRLANILSDLYFVLMQNFPDGSNYLIYSLNQIVTELLNTNPTQTQIIGQLQAIYASLSILTNELVLPFEIRSLLYQDLAILVSITFESSNQPTVVNNVYVTNQGSDTVSVIAGTPNHVIQTITVGSSPWAIAINEVTNRIYVANYGPDTVSVIDGVNNGVIATVAVGSAPRSITVNEVTNRIYVANYGPNTVSVIDGVNNGVIATVAVGSSPWAIAANKITNFSFLFISFISHLFFIFEQKNHIYIHISI
ncbi:YncE family protein [Paenibacillus sp. FSL K6-1230]|uniref:YncE family protein n=1 Tax=Paenibacillus sp. FSL K6-1230 TaxID=2921603 RepID=UPI0030F6BF7E